MTNVLDFVCHRACVESRECGFAYQWSGEDVDPNEVRNIDRSVGDWYRSVIKQSSYSALFLPTRSGTSSIEQPVRGSWSTPWKYNTLLNI